MQAVPASQYPLLIDCNRDFLCPSQCYMDGLGPPHTGQARLRTGSLLHTRQQSGLALYAVNHQQPSYWLGCYGHSESLPEIMITRILSLKLWS